MNEDIVSDMKLKDNIYFKYPFMVLCCSIRGLTSCIRSVVVIDGAYLKGK